MMTGRGLGKLLTTVPLSLGSNLKLKRRSRRNIRSNLKPRRTDSANLRYRLLTTTIQLLLDGTLVASQTEKQ